MRWAATVLLLLVVPGGSALAAEPRTLAFPTESVPIAAHGDWVAWSTRSEGGWTLAAWHRGTTLSLPVAPRSEPFDLDAGTDARGRTVLTYSRCTQAPARVGFAIQTWRGRGCRVHVLDLASGRERPVRVPRTRGSSDVMPSMWGGRVAFARHDPRHGKVAQLRLWDPATRRLRRLRHGAMPRGCPYRGGCSNVPPKIGSVQALDLGSRLLAFLWLIDGPGVLGHMGFEVRADRLADGRSFLAGSGYLGEVCTEGDDLVLPLGPTAAGDRVWFALMRSSCYRNRYSMARFDAARGRGRAGTLEGEMLQVVRTGGELVALVAPPPGDEAPSCSPSAPCRIQRMAAPGLTTPQRRARPPFF